MNRRRLLVSTLLGAGAFTILMLPVFAQQSGQVQGVAGVGSAVPVRPVAVGGADGSGNAKFMVLDSSGNLNVTIRNGATSLTGTTGVKVQGPTASGAALAGNPVLLAVSDGTLVKTLLTDAAGTPNAGSLFVRLSGGQVQNASPYTLTSYYPVVTGTYNAGNGNAYASVGDTSGRPFFVGAVATGAAVSGVNPVLVSGSDGTNAQALTTDTSGRLIMRRSVDPVYDTVTASGKKTSNGATAVAIAAAGSTGQFVYLCKFNAYNVSTTVVHTVDVISSGGTVLSEFTLSSGSSSVAGGNAVIDSDGFIHSAVNEGISFKIDAGGTSTDVIVTATTVTK